MCEEKKEKPVHGNGFKPFNLEEALKGHPVVTREGLPVTQITKFDGVGETQYPIRAVMNGEIAGYQSKGNYYSTGIESHMDLFMAPVKKQAWGVVHKHTRTGRIGVTGEYTSESEAFAAASIRHDGYEYIKCVLLHEWEE